MLIFSFGFQLNMNITGQVDWGSLFNNTQLLNGLIEYLIRNVPTVDSSLVDAFNFTRLEPLLQVLMETDPINLLNLLETFSPLVQESAGESWLTIEQLLYQYR